MKNDKGNSPGEGVVRRQIRAGYFTLATQLA